jgi:cytochrome P450
MADAQALRRSWRTLQRAANVTRLTVLGALGIGPRLPPGTLGPSALARYGDDRFYWRRFRRYGPVFKVLWNQNLTVCIVGFERAKRLFAAHGAALLPLTIEIESFVPFGFLRRMAPQPHAMYRGRFLSALRSDPTDTWEEDLRRLIRAELDGLIEADRSEAASALTPALDRIATRALLTMFFGVRPEQPQFALLEAGFRRMGPHEFVYPLGADQHAGYDAIRSLVWQAAKPTASDSSWAHPEGVLGRLISSDPSAFDETIVGNLIFMVEMGRYDVRSLMRWVLKYLSDAPGVIADLRNAVTTRADGALPALAESIVLETLRLDQAEALNRSVVADFEFEGHHIPKDSALRVLIRESHQDAAAFSEPEQFKPCRFSGKTYPSHAYAPFGVGDHRCIAARQVVRLCQLLVEELAFGYEWSVVGDGSRFRGRYHWEPAPSFDIALSHRRVTTA